MQLSIKGIINIQIYFSSRCFCVRKMHHCVAAKRSHGSGIKAKCKFKKRNNSLCIAAQQSRFCFFCWISCKCLEPGAVRIGMGWFYVKHFYVCAPPSSPKHQSVSGFFLSLSHTSQSSSHLLIILIFL